MIVKECIEEGYKNEKERVIYSETKKYFISGF